MNDLAETKDDRQDFPQSPQDDFTERLEVVLDPLISRTNDAASYLAGIMGQMGLGGCIAATVRNGAIYLEITGSEPGLVIGHRGQNLDALQHLVNRMVNRSNDEIIPVTVDSDKYRNRRLQQLQTLVETIGEEVFSTGETVITEPLTPSERRLFHIAANRIKGIRTVSSGSGFFQPIKVYSITRNRSQGDSYSSEYLPFYADAPVSGRRSGGSARRMESDSSPTDHPNFSNKNE